MRGSINHVILSFRHHATFPDVSVPFRKSQCSSRLPLFRQERPGRREWHKGAFNSSVISFWSEIQYFLTAAAPFRTRSASLLLPPELSASFLDRGRLECVHGIEKESTSIYVSVWNVDELDVNLSFYRVKKMVAISVCQSPYWTCSFVQKWKFA